MKFTKSLLIAIAAIVMALPLPGATAQDNGDGMAAQISQGGRYYDNLWLETDSTPPQIRNPHYPKGPKIENVDTWRCVSCHGWDPLVASTDCDWIDTHLVRINPFGVKAKMDEEPTRVVRQMKEMHRRGRGVLGMKIFGENGYDSPQKRMQSLKFVLGLGCVHGQETVSKSTCCQVNPTSGYVGVI